MNGTYKGYFKSNWGLQQCDPISRYLFILMEEFLSHLLKKDFAENKIGHFFHPRGAPLISHLLYADNLLVFSNGKKRLVKWILGTLEMYGSMSRQAVIKKNKRCSYRSRYLVLGKGVCCELQNLWKVIFQQSILEPHFSLGIWLHVCLNHCYRKFTTK